MKDYFNWKVNGRLFIVVTGLQDFYQTATEIDGYDPFSY